MTLTLNTSFGQRVVSFANGSWPHLHVAGSFEGSHWVLCHQPGWEKPLFLGGIKETLTLIPKRHGGKTWLTCESVHTLWFASPEYSQEEDGDPSEDDDDADPTDHGLRDEAEDQ